MMNAPRSRGALTAYHLLRSQARRATRLPSNESKMLKPPASPNSFPFQRVFAHRDTTGQLQPFLHNLNLAPLLSPGDNSSHNSNNGASHFLDRTRAMRTKATCYVMRAACMQCVSLLHWRFSNSRLQKSHLISLYLALPCRASHPRCRAPLFGDPRREEGLVA